MVRENEIAEAIVDAAFQIHKELGPGLFESVYETILEHELVQRGFAVERQKPIPISYKGLTFEEGFKADIVVDGLVVIELKSVERLSAQHSKQLLTYLKLTRLRLGLLINFGETLIKDGVQRLVNGLPDER